MIGFINNSKKCREMMNIILSKPYKKTNELIGKKIEKIEFIGEKDVYDLEVEPSHSFIVRNILCHNSNRIKFDMNPKRVGQVLFNSKQVWIKNAKTKKWEKMKYCKICSTPLPHFWVYRENNYYCINCGREKNVILLEKLNNYKEKRFFKFLMLTRRLLLLL
jgi:DNA-directed RNA polymerase beta' subunit